MIDINPAPGHDIPTAQDKGADRDGMGCALYPLRRGVYEPKSFVSFLGCVSKVVSFLTSNFSASEESSGFAKIDKV